MWILTTAAAGDENWGELPAGDGYGVATGFACDEGDANDSFCTARESLFDYIPLYALGSGTAGRIPRSVA